jgi:hypothetical protein
MCFKEIFCKTSRSHSLKNAKTKKPHKKDIDLRDTIQNQLIQLNCQLNEFRRSTEGKDYLVHLLSSRINEYNNLMKRDEELTKMCQNLNELHLRAKKKNDINKNKERFSEELEILINDSNRIMENSQVTVTPIPKNKIEKTTNVPDYIASVKPNNFKFKSVVNERIDKFIDNSTTGPSIVAAKNKYQNSIKPETTIENDGIYNNSVVVAAVDEKNTMKTINNPQWPMDEYHYVYANIE